MSKLSSEPDYFRASIARGLHEADSPVDRDGGMFGAGIIRGVSVITRGEALGHDLWIDQEFLADVTTAINSSKAKSGGIKARFTHPGMSSDGMGSHLGRLKDGKTEGDQVYADLHLTEASHNTPDGDLAGYVMDLAEESPEDFGLSIVFERDMAAEDQLLNDNTTRSGNRDIFVSPDEDNRANYRHARLSKLRAGDVVDEPAANPAGMFSVSDVPAQAEAVLSYVLGLSETHPGSIGGIDAERVKGFSARFLERHNLTLQENAMPKDTPDESVDRGAVESEVRSELKAAAERYANAFGEDGTKWFFDGVSFEDAQARHIEKLEKQLLAKDEEIGQLQAKLASLDTGEPDPVDPPQTQNGKRTFASKIRIAGSAAAN